MICPPNTAALAALHPATLARRWVCALAAVLVAGCAAGPTSHVYTLADPAPQATATARPAAPGQPPLFVEFAPIAVPERLARPQMLVRKPGLPSAQVQLLEFHRWSSSFEYELRDALASGVAARLGAIGSTSGVRAAGQPAWRVTVQVRQFDLVEGERADAAFSWTLRPPGAAEGLRTMSCQWSASEPAEPGVEALAQAAQRLAARAADAMARDLIAASTGGATDCVRTPAEDK